MATSTSTYFKETNVNFYCPAVKITVNDTNPFIAVEFYNNKNAGMVANKKLTHRDGYKMILIRDMKEAKELSFEECLKRNKQRAWEEVKTFFKKKGIKNFSLTENLGSIKDLKTYSV